MEHASSLTELRAQHRQLRQLSILLMIFAVLALVLYFVRPLYALLMLGISLAVQLLLVRRKTKAYISSFTSLAATLTLKRYLDQVQYSELPLFTEHQVRQSRMLPCNAASGGVVCHMGASGSYHGRSVTLGDVTLAHTFTEGGKKRHNFTIGCWVTVELEQNTGLDCRFLAGNTTPDASLKEMLWVEEDLKQLAAPIQLSQPWRVVCGQSNVMPGEPFLKQLDRLYRKTDGRVAVCVQGQQLHILLVGQILAQKVSGRIAPSDRFEEADLLPALGEALALSDKLASSFQL